MRQTIELDAMLAQHANTFGVTLLQDPLDFAIDDLRGRLAVRSGATKATERITGQERVLTWSQRHRPELFAHAPAGDHLTRQICGLLHVVFGARGAPTVDHFFGRATTHRPRDARPQVFLAVVVAIVVGPL